MRYGHQKFALGICILPVSPITEVILVPFCANTVTVQRGVEERSISLFLYFTTYLMMPINEHTGISGKKVNFC